MKSILIIILALVAVILAYKLYSFEKQVIQGIQQGNTKAALEFEDNMQYLAQNLSYKEAKNLRTLAGKKQNLSEGLKNIFDQLNI